MAGGKGTLEPLMVGFARAGAGSPHLVVRDLDLDAPCASAWISVHAPRDVGPFFSLRLAVHAIEAWFLADRAHAAESLRVHVNKLPMRPDDEPDPKLTIVALARASTKPALRAALVPRPGISRKAGAGYETWLLGASTGWSLERALEHSASLARAHERLRDLRGRWQAQT